MRISFVPMIVAAITAVASVIYASPFSDSINAASLEILLIIFFHYSLIAEMKFWVLDCCYKHRLFCLFSCVLIHCCEMLKTIRTKK